MLAPSIQTETPYARLPDSRDPLLCRICISVICVICVLGISFFAVCSSLFFESDSDSFPALHYSLLISNIHFVPSLFNGQVSILMRELPSLEIGFVLNVVNLLVDSAALFVDDRLLERWDSSSLLVDEEVLLLFLRLSFISSNFFPVSYRLCSLVAFFCVYFRQKQSHFRSEAFLLLLFLPLLLLIYLCPIREEFETMVAVSSPFLSIPLPIPPPPLLLRSIGLVLHSLNLPSLDSLSLASMIQQEK